MTDLLETFLYSPSNEWSQELPNHLDSDQTLVLAFGSPKFLIDPTPITELTRAFPNSKILGCSTAGEIHGTSLSDDSISVAVMRFQKTHLHTIGIPLLGSSAAHSNQVGQQIASQLMNHSNDSLQGVFLLSDGLIINGSELVAGLNAVLPSKVIVTGGLAGDGSNFQRTWVIHDGQPKSGYVTAVGLYGDQLMMFHGCQGGWDIFGPERRVTHSEANILYKLDDQPALELYKRYLGSQASGLPAAALHFPLSLKTRTGETVVRTILAVNEQDQSMTFAGDIPQDSTVQLMKANFERLIDAAGSAALIARSGFVNHFGQAANVLNIAVSCVGRRLVLGEHTEDELETASDFMPAGAKQVGFYSYGEISPHSTGRCDFHNQTMTLTTLFEI